MREFVGVKSPLDLILDSKMLDAAACAMLKREALIFDKIGIPGLQQWLPTLPSLFSSSSLADPLCQAATELVTHLEYLYEQGVIFETPFTSTGAQLERLQFDADYQRLEEVEEPFGALVKEVMDERGVKDLVDAANADPNLDHLIGHEEQIRTITPVIVYGLQHCVRKLCVQLRIIDRLDAYPLLAESFPFLPYGQTPKCDVVQVTLNSMPIPDESTPWEQIIEYRCDPDSRSKFLALRNWMSEVSRAALTPAETEEKLEYLIDQYQRHMNLHRLKTNVAPIETIFTTGLEVLGGFVGSKWGKAAQALFSLKRRQVALLEGELTAPGREVAYIVKAREAFGGV